MDGTVEDHFGRITFDVATGFVKSVDHYHRSGAYAQHYANVQKIDIEEYLSVYPEARANVIFHIPVKDIGLWTQNGDYVAPDTQHRREKQIALRTKTFGFNNRGQGIFADDYFDKDGNPVGDTAAWTFRAAMFGANCDKSSDATRTLIARYSSEQINALLNAPVVRSVFADTAFDAATGAVLNVKNLNNSMHAFVHLNIKQFDIEEYLSVYPEDLTSQTVIDFFDIGRWTKNDEYIAADPEFRQTRQNESEPDESPAP